MGQRRHQSRGIVYFNRGTKHLARLTTSLWSLRRMPTYDGAVTILDSGQSGGIIEKIASDGRLECDVVRVQVEQLRRNTCYVAKAKLWRSSPYETTIFLDADTLVMGDPSSLFEIVRRDSSGGVAVTHFADWVTTGDIIRGRIEKWRGVRCRGNDERFERNIDVARLVNKSLEAPRAAINTGVMAWHDELARGFLRDWERLTAAGSACPFTDELAAQLLIRTHKHTLVDDRYNCSPIYGKMKREAIVWHAHGGKHLKRADGRGEQGHAIWLPWIVDAWRENVGRIQEWASGSGDDALTNNLDAIRREA